MTGTITKHLITEGLKALGVDKDTAKFLGLVTGTAVAVLTLDPVHFAVEATAHLSEGAVTAVDIHASVSA